MKKINKSNITFYKLVLVRNSHLPEDQIRRQDRIVKVPFCFFSFRRFGKLAQILALMIVEGFSISLNRVLLLFYLSWSDIVRHSSLFNRVHLLRYPVQQPIRRYHARLLLYCRVSVRSIKVSLSQLLVRRVHAQVIPPRIAIRVLFDTFSTCLAFLRHHLHVSVRIVSQHLLICQIARLVLIARFFVLCRAKTVTKHLLELRKLVLRQLVYVMLLNFYLFICRKFCLQSVRRLIAWRQVGRVRTACRFHTARLWILRRSRLHRLPGRFLTANWTIVLDRVRTSGHLRVRQPAGDPFVRLVSL